MLERLREVAGLTVDLARLDEQSDAYLERVEEGLSERPDVADMVRQLEVETEAELPSGEDLARRSSGSSATSADRRSGCGALRLRNDASATSREGEPA